MKPALLQMSRWKHGTSLMLPWDDLPEAAGQLLSMAASQTHTRQVLQQRAQHEERQEHKLVDGPARDGPVQRPKVVCCPVPGSFCGRGAPGGSIWGFPCRGSFWGSFRM